LLCLYLLLNPDFDPYENVMNFASSNTTNATRQTQNTPSSTMWKSFFGWKDTSKRPAAAATLTTDADADGSDSAKKLKLNERETPTRKDTPAPRAAAPSVIDADAPPLATSTKAECGLRSMAEAHKCRDQLMNGADMCGLPVGPYETEEQIMEAVQAWAAKPETNGGAFGIPPKQEKLKPASSRPMRGPRRLLLCDRNGKPRPSRSKSSSASDASRPKQQQRQRTKKCNCPWGVWIEQCCEGWTTVELPKKARDNLLCQPGATVATVHNHALLQTNTVAEMDNDDIGECPNTNTAPIPPQSVIDLLELADRVELSVSPHKKRRGITNSEQSGNNDAAGDAHPRNANGH
jgi:hypothetical protein